MTRKHWMWAALGAAVLIVTLGAAAAASGVLQPQSPEQAQGRVIVPPLLAPPLAEANYAPGEVPNRVVQVRGDLVITISGDLPVAELEALMPEVTVH